MSACATSKDHVITWLARLGEHGCNEQQQQQQQQPSSLALLFRWQRDSGPLRSATAHLLSTLIFSGGLVPQQLFTLSTSTLLSTLTLFTIQHHAQP